MNTVSARAIRRQRHDAADRPFVVIWESTRTCPLACRHCRPVPEPIVAEMASAAHAAGAHLYVPDIPGTRSLLRLTTVAEARNHAHPARVAETRTWITTPGADSAYGIPLTALGPPDAGRRMPMRDFTGPLPLFRRPALWFERHVQTALLWTAHDRREDWLRAGQALQ